MENCIIELKKIFSFAFDVYGLNPHQLIMINNSILSIEESITNYNKKKTEIYVTNYNVLAKLLNNVQQVGNVFNLDDASKVYNKLKSIKTYLETKKQTDNLDNDFQFIKAVVNNCFFVKMTFNLEDTNRLVKAMDELAGLNNPNNKDVNQMENINLIKRMIDISQTKGKFNLEQVDKIINTLSELRKNVIKFNVDKEKKRIEKESKKESKKESEKEQKNSGIEETIVKDTDEKPVKTKRKYNKKKK